MSVQQAPSLLNMGGFASWLMSSVAKVPGVSEGLLSESTVDVIKMLENSQRVIAGTDSALSPPPLPRPPSLSSQCQLSVMSVSVLMMLLQCSAM